MDDETFDDFAPELEDEEFVTATSPMVVTARSHAVERAMETATALAAASSSGIVTCEHLLLGLAEDPGAAAARVLSSCGFDASTLHTRIDFVRGSLAPAEEPPAVSISPRVERVFALAGREAANRKRDRIETLHVLIGLLRERHGIAAFVLEEPGVGHERLGAAISQATRNGVSDLS